MFKLFKRSPETHLMSDEYKCLLEKYEALVKRYEKEMDELRVELSKQKKMIVEKHIEDTQQLIGRKIPWSTQKKIYEEAEATIEAL